MVFLPRAIQFLLCFLNIIRFGKFLFFLLYFFSLFIITVDVTAREKTLLCSGQTPRFQQ
eukprot:UN23781